MDKITKPNAERDRKAKIEERSAQIKQKAYGGANKAAEKAGSLVEQGLDALTKAARSVKTHLSDKDK